MIEFEDQNPIETNNSPISTRSPGLKNFGHGKDDVKLNLKLNAQESKKSILKN